MAEQQHTEQSSPRPDIWESARGFRALPCMNTQRRVWVEVNSPDRIVELSTHEARELAEHLHRVAGTADAWRSQGGVR